MLVLSGALLVLLSWGVALAGIGLIGLPLAAVTHSAPLSWADVRRGVWWGLTVVAMTVMLLSIALPMASPVVPLVVLGLVLMGGAATLILIRHRGWRSGLRLGAATLAVLVLAVTAAAYLAVAALGPVTNFDSGLYHLNAILHASEYPAIPGLANLQAPLGYANASFPMAAAWSSTPWGSDGFRLVNGLVICAVLADLILRWSTTRRSAGTYGLLVGVVVLLVPMVALSDYWVTSPSQDSAVFAVTIAASALVMDAVAGSPRRWADLGAALSAAVVLVLLRPTMGTYLLGVAIVGAVLLARSRPQARAWRRPALLALLVAGMAALAQAGRDYVLSGWLLYPLSVLPFDVPWRATDPVALRTATLGYHRDPTDLWEAAEGWSWVGPWLGQVPRQWEAWLLLLLAGTAGVVGLAAHRSGIALRLRGLVLAIVPSVVAIVLWWLVTPPSFRFAWGPLFSLGTVPLGWLLWRVAVQGNRRSKTFVALVLPWAAALPVVVVVVFSALTRLDVGSMTLERSWHAGITIPYRIAATQAPPTDVRELSQGLVVQVPRDGAPCWDASLLCTPEPDDRAGFLDPGAGLAGGISLN